MNGGRRVLCRNLEFGSWPQKHQPVVALQPVEHEAGHGAVVGGPNRTFAAANAAPVAAALVLEAIVS